jgi:zona occludens toxin (predicted ATPase)
MVRMLLKMTLQEQTGNHCRRILLTLSLVFGLFIWPFYLAVRHGSAAAGRNDSTWPSKAAVIT